MLKYLLGIVTALIFVAALAIWATMPATTGGDAANGAADATAPATGGTTADTTGGTTGSTTGATPGATADTTSGGAAPPAPGDGSGSGAGSLLPAPQDGGGTRGLKLGGGAAAGPMRRHDIPALGFGIDVPEAWLTLDAIAMRRYFAEVQGMTDQQQVNALVSTIVLAAIPGWPGDGAVANVIINHRLAPRRDEMAILNTILDQKRAALDGLDVIQPPTVGQLGPFWGASVRTREIAGSGEQATTTVSVVWILRIADGYMVISAEAPDDDADAQAQIERMLGSVAAMRKPG